MATALQGFRLTARSCKCRPAAHHCATKSVAQGRPFSVTVCQSREQKKEVSDPALLAALDKAGKGANAQHGQYLQSEAARLGENLKRFDQTALKMINNRVHMPAFPWQRRKEKVPRTFMNEGEDDAVDGFPETEEEESANISSLAHGELEQHREMRHYARLAAWEMPMLASEYSGPSEFYSITYTGEYLSGQNC
jgi:small subunit ribosomal protein S35